jgi:hypothetical protein
LQNIYLEQNFSSLCLLFNKIRDKSRTGSAWKRGGVGSRGWGQETEGRNDPSNVCTCEQMNKKKKKSQNPGKNKINNAKPKAASV